MPGSSSKRLLRWGGAQIPVSSDCEANTRTLIRAIDWAAEQGVDYLVTPEGALSGYARDWHSDPEQLAHCLREVEAHAAKRTVAVFLGTLWQEGHSRQQQLNQIRFYGKDGVLHGRTNKKLLTAWDEALGIEEGTTPNIMIVPWQQQLIPTAGFICCDLYGREGWPNQVAAATRLGVRLLIHSTNAIRDRGTVHDSVMWDWHSAHFRLITYLARLPLITVDNCWHMEGTAYSGSTSSPSGVIISGQWQVQVPRQGSHYFYADLDPDQLLAGDWSHQAEISSATFAA